MDNYDFLKNISLPNSFEIKETVSEDDFDFVTDAVNCFAFTDEFQQKRFNRYVEKIKTIIFDYLRYEVVCLIGDLTLNQTLIYIFEGIYYQKLSIYIKENNITDEEMKEIIKNTPLEDFKEMIKKKSQIGVVFCKLLHNTKAEPKILGLHQYIGIVGLISIANVRLHGEISVPKIEEFIDYAFKNTCSRFIRNKYLKGLIDKDSFFKCVPETELEKFLFLEDLINDINIDITNAYITNAEQYDEYIEPFQSNVFKEQDKKIKLIKEENDKLKTEIEAKNKELNNLEKDNRILKEKLSSQQKNPEIKKLQNRIKELIHEKEKISKDYKHISDKYEKLKEIKTNVNVSPDELEKTFKEVDCNLNYLFVVDTSKLKLNNAIKEVFPNAIFYDSFVNIQNMNIDMVICMTSHIDHVQYKKFKSQCKTKGVQFLHCSCQNPQMIKEEIWKLINKESV